MSQGVPTVAGVTVAVQVTPYGAPALEALCEEVERARHEAGHFMAPVTVVVGEYRLAIHTRRALARRGFIGVDCMSLHKLAERLAGEVQAARGRRPASAAVLAAVVRQVLQTTATGVFGEVRDHLATERALADAHRALRDLEERELATLAKSSARAADVVAVSRQVQRRLAAEGFHDERDLLTEATKLVRSGRLDTLADLGRVVLYLPQRLNSASLDLLAALGSALAGFTVLAGSCGDEQADAPVAAVVRRLAGAEAWRPSAVPVSVPTRIIAVPDADEEVRTALRGVVEAIRRGVPLERIAVLYGRRDPYARLLADQLKAAELPFSGPSARPLTESVLGRFLLGLLGLSARRYSRSDVMAWLSAAPIRAALDPGEDGRWRPVPVAAWERISRRAGVLDGADEWDRRLKAYCANRRSEMDRLGEDSDWRRAHIERDVATADGLRRFMNDVLARAESASGLATWRLLAQWAERSVRDLVGGAEWREGNWPAHERAAAERVEACLERLDGLDRVDPAPDLARFRRALEAELATGRGRQGRTGHGLLIGPVEVALGVDLECVWVLGMAEGVFPGQAVEDTLLGETERAAVPEALPVASARLADDHRRFLAALAGASAERTLLYPRGDLRRTANQLPSRWLLAVAQALTVTGVGEAEAFLGSADLAKLPDGTFSDVTAASGTGLDANGMGSAVADFDGDGHLDWYVTSVYGELRETVAGTGNMLYRNRGGHRFTESAAAAGVQDGGWGWGAVAVDLDHDGRLDIVTTNGWEIANGAGFPEWEYERTYLFHNDGDLTFTEVAAAWGLHHTGQGRGLAHFDYDNDGDQDLAIFTKDQRILLYRNDLAAPDRHWLRVLLDTRSRPDLAPDGIGARVIVRTAAPAAGKQVRYLYSGGSYLTSSELSAHFGLGPASRVAELRVEWPDGSLTLLHDLPADRIITIPPDVTGS